LPAVSARKRSGRGQARFPARDAGSEAREPKPSSSSSLEDAESARFGRAAAPPRFFGGAAGFRRGAARLLGGARGAASAISASPSPAPASPSSSSLVPLA